MIEWWHSCIDNQFHPIHIHSNIHSNSNKFHLQQLQNEKQFLNQKQHSSKQKQNLQHVPLLLNVQIRWDEQMRVELGVHDDDWQFNEQFESESLHSNLELPFDPTSLKSKCQQSNHKSNFINQLNDESVDINWMREFDNGPSRSLPAR